MMTTIEPDEASREALKRIEEFPALSKKVSERAVESTLRSGRRSLVNMLFAKMGIRWKTIAQRRAKYKKTGPTSGEIVLSDEPMQVTSFKGQWSGGAYIFDVLKSGMRVVVPHAFIGKNLKGKWTVFSRDASAGSREQAVGHYQKNIGKKRKPTHRAKPILMSDVVAKDPVSFRSKQRS
jgi:hypothetical protein